MRATAWGAAVGLAILASAVAVAAAAGDGGTRSTGLALAAVVAALAAFAAAGAVAGWLRSDRPIRNGGSAAVVVALGGLLIGLAGADGDQPNRSALTVIAIVVLALLFGVGGALGADWLRRRRRAQLSR